MSVQQAGYRMYCSSHTIEKRKSVLLFSLTVYETCHSEAFSLKKPTFTWDTQEKLRILQPETEHQASVGDYKANTNEKTRALPKSH